MCIIQEGSLELLWEPVQMSGTKVYKRSLMLCCRTLSQTMNAIKVVGKKAGVYFPCRVMPKEQIILRHKSYFSIKPHFSSGTNMYLCIILYRIVQLVISAQFPQNTIVYQGVNFTRVTNFSLWHFLYDTQVTTTSLQLQRLFYFQVPACSPTNKQ